jgi:hypothetical protein
LNQHGMRGGVKLWSLATAVVGAGLYAAALSGDLYDLTSPPVLSWHILLRKAYSIVAFVLVGYLLRRAFAERARRLSPAACALAVALYSAAIEIGQAFVGSHEGLAWNAVDVACGAIGGLLASAIPASRPTEGTKR